MSLSESQMMMVNLADLPSATTKPAKVTSKRFFTSFSNSMSIFCVLLLLCLLLSMVLFKGPLQPEAAQSDTACSTVCLQPGCIKAAAEILSLIDETVSPCDDFYRFACGGWLNRTAIPDGTGHVSTLEQSQERLNIELKNLIERSKGTTPAIVTMQNLYRSCMNLSAIEKLGTSSLEGTLKELGGWPVLEGDTWNEAAFGWIYLTKRIRTLGLKANMFVNFKVITDVKNNTRNMIFLDEPTLGLRRQLITQGANHTTVRVYHRLMVDTAMLLGAKNQSQVEAEMWDVLELEAQIANATHDPTLRKNQGKNHYKLYELAGAASELHMLLFLSRRLPAPPNRLGTEWIHFVNAAIDLNEAEGVPSDEVVFLGNVNYLRQLEALLVANRHKRRLLANYMLWRVVLDSLQSGSRSMRHLMDNLEMAVHGITEKQPRWKVCLDTVTGASMPPGGLAMALSSLYIKHHFTGQLREKAVEMVRFLQDEFTQLLNKTEWMDSETKENALKKAASMKAIVGYPAELANDTLVEEHYRELNLTADNFEANLRRLRTWEQKNEFKKLRPLNDPHNWKDYANAATVNAFYGLYANGIVIPAGILRDIFFASDRPQYLNFGTIGYVIGHEITHGFDSSGSRFDETGNVRNWWNSETRGQFNEKTQCMKKQYAEYQLEGGLHINSEQTLVENIADNGAIRVAYQAYTVNFDPELSLPGLKYTPRQLFWIALASNACSKFSPEMFKTGLDTDNHSPPEARVNVAFSNYAPFAEAFQCKSGTALNPVHKCTVW